ncbi:substrate-binding domain-containing protein [bacterium]|nr:substrate-binding domain-containing protein [bacterium]
MKHFKLFVIAVFILAAFIAISGCTGNNGQDNAKKKELLIYCGITMVKPMVEIVKIIEVQEDCKIIISKGGSGNMLNSIKINNVGDLYLPGSESYINTCLEEGLVTKTAHIGFNKAAMMVQKGNPKNITADLENLASDEYRIVICNPISGSIGKETKKILEKKGILDDVLDNVLELTTDSKDLTRVLVEKEADLVVNWFATSTWPENEPYIDVIPINDEYAEKKKLIIGLLKTSKYPEIAEKFMEYASSEKGHDIFNKYGLYDVE